MKKRILTLALLLSITFVLNAQTKKSDTVIVELAKSSKVIFIMKNRSDLPTLKAYNYQALFNDIIAKIEARDTTTTTPLLTETESKETPTVKEEDWSSDNSYRKEGDDRDNDSDNNYYSYNGNRSRSRFSDRRTWHSFNFDLGTNNYLQKGKFPDADNAPYAVRPWGSWYVALNSVQRTHVTGKFFLEWGLGVSWYNFKFEDDRAAISKDANGITFAIDSRNLEFKKSKLTATFVNASFIPMLDFGKGSRKVSIFDGSRVDFSYHGNRHSSSFRIGAGPYAGYRIDSFSKVQYKENGDKRNVRDRDSYYLNNIRYGARVQIGFRDTDLFFNYDFNELFASGKGPSLNAFSFGVIF